MAGGLGSYYELHRVCGCQWLLGGLRDSLAGFPSLSPWGEVQAVTAGISSKKGEAVCHVQRAEGVPGQGQLRARGKRGHPPTGESLSPLRYIRESQNAERHNLGKVSVSCPPC